MGKLNQEPAVAFAEVPRPVRPSSPAVGATGDEAAMMRRLVEDASHIFLATGATDFRKQIPGLAAAVSMLFKLGPFEVTTVFIFFNKKRDAIKVPRYDQNGFASQPRGFWTG